MDQLFQFDAIAIDVTISGQLIRTTPLHPFFVVGQGWTPAGELQTGMELAVEECGTATVDAIDHEPRNATVYNFRVEEDHTYFVGKPDWGFAVWVHNSYYIQETAPGSGIYKVIDDATGLAAENGKLFSKQGAKDAAQNYNKNLLKSQKQVPEPSGTVPSTQKSTFKLPETWRSAKGVSGTFSDGKHTFRIDTNNLSADESFHIHIYDEKGGEIAVIQGKGSNGVWREGHRGEDLKKPSQISGQLLTDIRRLARAALKNLQER